MALPACLRFGLTEPVWRDTLLSVANEHVFIKLSIRFPSATKTVATPLKISAITFAFTCVLAATIGPVSAQTASQDAGWRPLFNGKNFDGWYTFLTSVGKNNDPNKVFKIENGMIHVLDVPDNPPDMTGYLATNQEYGHARVRLEYKFGTKRYGSRSEARRDAGLLYYFFGPDFVWGNNLELQIQEQDTGDLWINGGVSVTSPVIAPAVPIWGGGGGAPYTVKSTYSAGRRNRPPGTSAASNGSGQADSVNIRRILKSGDFENRDGWNTVEAVLDGDRVTHLVNGRVVFTGHTVLRQDESNPDKWTPLTAGKICLEAEGAEVWYRNIEIKDIPAR